MKEHGVYTIETHGRVLFIDAEGPWNTESVMSYKRDMHEATLAMGSDPWAVIAVLHGECLFTPEAESEMVAMAEHRIQYGMKCVALVSSDVIGRSMVERQFGRIYRTAGVECQFFHDNDSAFRWLRSKGYHA